MMKTKDYNFKTGNQIYDKSMTWTCQDMVKNFNE